jgi:hypothetical protein
MRQRGLEGRLQCQSLRETGLRKDELLTLVNDS